MANDFTPVRFQLIRAMPEHKKAIKNLMQFYMYDFSEYIDIDVAENALFAPYPDVKQYLQNSNNKFAFVIKTGNKYLGFVFVKFIESKERDYFSIAEFFILKKYRRLGIGQSVAQQIFKLYRGQWQIHQRQNNKPAHAFWKKIINEYTSGKFKERLEEERFIQSFET